MQLDEVEAICFRLTDDLFDADWVEKLNKRPKI